MKREEKNQQTRRKILDAALKEFAQRGYGASSVNTICSVDGISKGIIYHYFSTKEELYLACVKEVFQQLTEHLRAGMRLEQKLPNQQLETYFHVRLEFFLMYPEYQRIFCEAVMMPPIHLKEAISERKAEFDALNILILNQIMEPLKLRAGISREKVADIFRQAQDYINARYQVDKGLEVDIHAHEKECRQALDILFYGVVEREGAVE